MLPKFIYSHARNRQVLQRFHVFIIFKTTKIFIHCGLRINVGFVHNDILATSEPLEDFEETLEKKHMVENETEEHV
jgi:hypothetical protein